MSVKKKGAENNTNDLATNQGKDNEINNISVSEDDILEDVEKHQQEFKREQNAFPLEIFPQKIRNIVNATNDCLKFSTDFMGSSMLYAVSVAIGNTHAIKVNTEWTERAILYLSLVGKPGTNKTHPLKFALKPIEDMDSFNYNCYKRELSEYETAMTLSGKEKKENGYENIEKPNYKQFLVSDFTPEALVEVHQFNKRGIGVYADELASWINNFNRYNKGSEEEFWLSLWSGAPIRINRKNGGPLYLKLPFVPVIGTIQPKTLQKISKNRDENGFIDRILFVAPKQLKNEYWSEKQLSKVFVDDWNQIISSLLSMPIKKDENNNIEPVVLSFSKEAKSYLFDWQKKITDESNTLKGSFLSGIYAKIQNYAIRFSLCLEILQYACGESQKESIGLNAVKGAVKLAEYFIQNAISARGIIEKFNTLGEISQEKKILYKRLPECFKTQEGIEIGLELDVSKSTCKRFFKKEKLFKKISHGVYKKI